MKKKVYVPILLIGIVIACFSCLQDEIKNQSSDANEIENGLTIEEAKAFFESQMSVVSSRSIDDVNGGLLPGDFTPCWSNAIASNNEKISNIDVSILPQYRYKVMRCKVSNGAARAYSVSITQKMVITKDLKTNKLGLYYVTLIPDRAYYNKNRGDISSHFISRGSKKTFSGLVIYSLPQIQMPIKVEKYVSGERIFRMILPTFQGKTSDNLQIFKKIIGDMRFAVSQSVKTRFGEYDSFWDWFEEEVWPDAEDGDKYTMEHDDDGWYLDDGNGGRIDIPDDVTDDGDDLNNDWFQPGNWPPHDDDWGDTGDSDISDMPSPEAPDLPSPSGPILQVYHKACGNLLTVVDWNDWDGDELFCSRCGKVVSDFEYTYSMY